MAAVNNVYAADRGDTTLYRLSGAYIDEIEVPKTDRGRVIIRTSDLDLRGARMYLARAENEATRASMEGMLALPKTMETAFSEIAGVRQVDNMNRSGPLANRQQFVLSISDDFDLKTLLDKLVSVKAPNGPNPGLLSADDVTAVLQAKPVRPGVSPAKTN